MVDDDGLVLPTSAGPPVYLANGHSTNGPPLIRQLPPALPPRIVKSVEDAEEEDRMAAELELEKKIERERIVKGLNNDDLNALLRMFDKQVQNVHICTPSEQHEIAAGLDMQPSAQEEFTLDKMRSNLERFYASVGMGLLRAVLEVQRIRKWEEGGSRSLVALLVYSLAWYNNQIFTTLLLFFATLILVPSSRSYCFSAPMNSDIKEEQDASGLSASEDKANKWADSVTQVITSFATPGGGGKGGQNVEKQVTEEVNGVIVKDMRKKEDVNDMKDKSDKEKAIILYARPTMRIIGGLADKWERIANALEPTPPFALEPGRMRVFCWLIAPLLLVSMFVSERMFSRVFGLLFGFVMFGQPIISWINDELNRRYPHWFQTIILQYNILSDVPTNTQLVLRLLRDAEHKRRPLPPPPHKEGDADSQTPPESTGDDDVSDDQAPKEQTMQKSMSQTKEKVTQNFRTKIRRGWDKAGWLKEESFAWISGHKTPDYERIAKTTLDKLKVSHDAKPVKAILQRLPSGVNESSPDTPSRYYVHHVKHGPGHLIIHPPTVPIRGDDPFTPARITFTTIRRVSASRNISVDPDEDSKKGNLTVSINDVVALKKEGMSWPRRAITSWALDTQGAGGTGLEIKIVRRGMPQIQNANEESEDGLLQKNTEGKEEVIKLKSIVRRDELFSRLLSIGEQRWELL
ncbi:uncharacterized protein IL334_003600 [Kwoniella shivajii]|uniref:Uncharacterized protein n=1 Tax=Kwoniella shivajii TaxID=564305 RepID=A0ABZ1CY04_9TREE|nr:hypothetical protein IL334_003600 [Kwoniella shivajii]